MGVFLLSYNSRSSEDFIGLSCNLKPDGGLILLLCFSACYFLIYVNARMLNYISHHISSCISNSSYYISNACMNYKIQGEISMIQLFKCALLQKQIPHYAHLQGEFFYILQSNSSISVFTLHMFIPVENLTYIVINHQKGGDCKCIQCPLVILVY